MASGRKHRKNYPESLADTVRSRKAYASTGDWLLCHAAAVIPIAFACYHADGDLRRIRQDKAYLNRVMDATIAAYGVLEENGHSILPKSDQEYKSACFMKKYLPFYRLICSTKIGRLCTSDHAMNATDEMNALNRVLKQRLQQYGPVPSAWLDLERDTNGWIEEEHPNGDWR